MNLLRISTSPGPGSASSVATSRNASCVGQPTGREARWISRVGVVMGRSCHPPGAGERVLQITAASSWDHLSTCVECKGRSSDGVHYHNRPRMAQNAPEGWDNDDLGAVPGHG